MPPTAEGCASVFSGCPAPSNRCSCLPTAAARITREHVEAFVTHLVETRSPATAHVRYRALRSLFGWLVEEGEVRESPMARMSPPKVKLCRPLFK